jgi:hypothetical protein
MAIDRSDGSPRLLFAVVDDDTAAAERLGVP